MNEIKTKLVWTGGLKFTGANQDGQTTAIDGKRQDGPSPMDLLLEAIGACSAIDVVVILEKMRLPLARLEVALEGVRRDAEPRYYTAVRARFDAWGDGLAADKLERAIQLSFAKYCSVYHSLRPDLQLHAQYRLHAAEAEVAGEYQSVAMAAETGAL